MLLTSYGAREWIGATVIAAPLIALPIWFGWWPLAIVPAGLWLFVIQFFRDPPRPTPADLPAGAMLSPADGRISAVERVFTHPATGEQGAVIIRIFLNVFNVHINRAPCEVTTVNLEHHDGEYLDARNPKSAVVNESNLVTFRIGASDDTLGVKQISGAIARRIVCPLAPGRTLDQGEKYGMIKFGSTTELILPRPDDVDVRVEVGDKVTGGRTVLAVLTPASGSSTA